MPKPKRKVSHYLVTFDLIGSEGRNNEYSLAEQALKFRFGPENYWKIVKQCAIVRTGQGAVAIRDTLSQRLGANTNILVVKLQKGYAYRLRDSRARASAIDCLGSIE